MTTPTPTPTTRRAFISRLLAATGATALAARAAAYNLPKPEQTQAIPCAQTEAYHSFDVGEHGPLEPVAVQGAAIKVPTNRYSVIHRASAEGPVISQRYCYIGDWDGTFRYEYGCTNPAYILASLTPAGRDWVLCDDQGDLNWTMLLHWGMWCDELVSGTSDEETARTMDGVSGNVWCLGHIAPRFTANVACRTPEQMAELRETLRMHCLSWQSTDPRYRTSWPGMASLDQRVAWENRA